MHIKFYALIGLCRIEIGILDGRTNQRVALIGLCRIEIITKL